MTSLRIFLLILVTLLCREFETGLPATSQLNALIAVAAAVLGAGLLFKAWTLSILVKASRRTHLYGTESAQRCERARNSVESVWLALLPAVLLATDWGRWLQLLESSGFPISLSLVCWFGPSVFVLLLLDLTAAQADEILSGKRDCDQHWKSQWLLRIRLGDIPAFLSCIAPVFMIAYANDIAGMVFAAKPVWLIALVNATIIGLFAATLPCLLGCWMGTSTPTNPQLSNRYIKYRDALGLRGPDLRIVSSNGRWSGAAVVGCFPGFRQLWLSDRLVDDLSENEIDMVMMHELAHVTRYHSFVRLAPLVAAGFAFAVAFLLAPGITTVDSYAILAKCLGTIFATVVLLYGISVAAHYCEHDADREACRLAQRTCGWARQNSAPLTLANALSSLGNGTDSTKATWLHPSLESRMRRLRIDRSVNTNPSVLAADALSSLN